MSNFKRIVRNKVKELAFSRRYSLMPRKRKGKPVLIIMFDNKIMHGGLLDRIKGIISAAAIAKAKGFEFKIFTDTTFPLFKFLKPVDTFLQAKQVDVLYNRWLSKPVVMYNFLSKNKGKLLKPFSITKQQFHFYFNTNVLGLFYPSNNQKESDALWRKAFLEIFSFDDFFQQQFNSLFNYGDAVCGIHLRFVSLLGDFIEVTNTPLPEPDKSMLVTKCLDQIQKIMELHPGNKFLIVSDSGYFLTCVKEHFSTAYHTKRITVLDGSIAHIDVDHSEEVLKKALLDFYLLSRCKNIYQVLGERMYNSQFSKYAAILGDAEYTVCKV